MVNGAGTVSERLANEGESAGALQPARTRIAAQSRAKIFLGKVKSFGRKEYE